MPEDVKTFWVHHDQHRLSHPVKTILTIFPECSGCGDRVRFEPTDVSPAAVTFLRHDSDFKEAAKRIPRKKKG